MYAVLKLLFCTVILLKYPAVPDAFPSDITIAVLELTPFIIVQFLTDTFVIGVVPVDPTSTT